VSANRSNAAKSTGFKTQNGNRYETELWRQVAQTLFILDTCKKRLPSL
jgi:hypothetical protein